ncbi:flagellar biosynthesis protein FlhF [Desulfolutivibrio sulfoxidireducens]|uniref:flagellar biosynthesis protein FlhF n=1 Tax=Desulfolutivibrio sulfoxidireducens TaxID=2773299 RepID=UPI00159D86D1|nr:flagellar biosynthesis protein FlhF [Desulfolutivibrio sulfoxidireducens]QLA19707.1 flagellar biosynthesis protein FlhF [Desulfolutivibrio sulfoxidireducens]
MRVKTFRDKNMGRVLARIKSELGPDAVILSNQTVRENGQCLCEIMAAVDTDEGSPQAGVENKILTIPQNTVAPAAPGPAAGVPDGDWRREWEEIRGHMLALMKPGLALDKLDPRQRLAMHYLEREGVEDAVLLTVFRSITKCGEKTVLPALSRVVTVKPLPSGEWNQRIHVLAGPNGAGKTTAVLRLALAKKREHPETPVHVATLLDGGGDGSMLKRYAELSGIAFHSVSGAEKYRELCASLGRNGFVFAEMPSLRPGENMDERLRALGMAGSPEVAVHLVVSPTCSTSQLKAFAGRYRVAAPGSIIWTKLDEACNFAGLVNMAYIARLPVSALSHGPDLTRSLVPASANAVWKLVFKHQLPGDSREEADAGDTARDTAKNAA